MRAILFIISGWQELLKMGIKALLNFLPNLRNVDERAFVLCRIIKMNESLVKLKALFASWKLTLQVEISELEATTEMLSNTIVHWHFFCTFMFKFPAYGKAGPTLVG
jgi:hypothetical protein